ncbi:glucosyltransferase domain-containing protein [Helicobacter sp. T3_23-1056]
MTKRQESQWQEIFRKWQEVFRIPKWAKISLVVFSAVATLLLAGSFALQKWADSQLESANLTLTKIDKAKNAELSEKSSAESISKSSLESISGKSSEESQIYAYEAQVHFARLDFLLRSKTISHIDLQSVAWAKGIDSNAIKTIETHNRRLDFTTTQNLALDSFDLGANLGAMSYKMDFSPLPKVIVKYALTIIALFLVAIYLYRFIILYESGKITLSFGEISLPSAIWSGYKNINPLYRHSFWIVFVACNVVFGFHTVQFLWGNHDWYRMLYNNGIFSNVYEGRYTQGLIKIIQGEQLLPILNNVISFAFLAFASVWLCIYLNIQRKLWIWASIGLLLTLQPFTLAKMYYAYQITCDFFAVAIGILGFILAKKAGESNQNDLNNSGVSNSLSLSLS